VARSIGDSSSRWTTAPAASRSAYATVPAGTPFWSSPPTPDATWAPSTRRFSCSDPDEGMILRLLQDGH